MEGNKIFLAKGSENELPEETEPIWTLAAFLRLVNTSLSGIHSETNDPLYHYLVFFVSSFTFRR